MSSHSTSAAPQEISSQAVGPSSRKILSGWRLVHWLGAAVLALVFLGGLSVQAISWWVNYSQHPVPSDVIVVLAGSYSRPPYAAELFRKGYGREVWISRPLPPLEDRIVREMGVRYPLEEQVNYDILLKGGVPRDRIRFYGKDVNSTVDEARALQKEWRGQGNKILVITSRFHARRSRMIFRHHLPKAEIRVAATPYEAFDRHWWRHKELAKNSILEILKTVYYCVGLHLITAP